MTPQHIRHSIFDFDRHLPDGDEQTNLVGSTERPNLTQVWEYVVEPKLKGRSSTVQADESKISKQTVTGMLLGKMFG